MSNAIFPLCLPETPLRRHPLKQFQEVDFAAAAAHFVGHVVYGTLVGLVVSLLQFSLP